MIAKGRIILGIDPGTTIMGYGITEEKATNPVLLEMDVLKLQKEPSHPAKLRSIFECTLKLIDTYHPDELAIEAPFYGANVQSMLKLGRAQGVAIAAAVYRDIPITEYSPRKIKMAITGSGKASKEQVAQMLKSIFKINEMPKHLDATDGLAVALCHHFQRNAASGNSLEKPTVKKSASKSKGYSGWDAFVKQNPDKLK